MYLIKPEMCVVVIEMMFLSSVLKKDEHFSLQKRKIHKMNIGKKSQNN